MLLKGHVGSISQPVLIMLISVLKGNPYLVNWFNPSIWLVHGLVSVTDECNMISEAVARQRYGGAEPGNSRRNRPNVRFVCLGGY